MATEDKAVVDNTNAEVPTEAPAKGICSVTSRL